MWNELTDAQQADAAMARSAHRPQLFFKHSTRCAISSMAKSRIERAMDKLAAVADLHYLDLLAHRPVSNHLADITGVHHESPQLILIVNGECVLDQSHSGIDPLEVLEVAGKTAV